MRMYNMVTTAYSKKIVVLDQGRISKAGGTVTDGMKLSQYSNFLCARYV